MQYMTDLGSSQTIELTNKIKKDNYDGIIADTEIIAFYPWQIKSATDNNGNFNIKNNNIFEQNGMKKYVSIIEEIMLNLSVGDQFKYGKFKNKTATVAKFDKNEKGEDVIITDTGKSVRLLNVRLIKE